MSEKGISILNARQLHNREYIFEEYIDGEWVSKGEVSILPEAMFVNNVRLHNAAFHADENVVKYSFGSGVEHKSGLLNFDQQFMSFIGSYSNKDGSIATVRGNQKKVIYKTSFKKDKDYQDGEDFTIETCWEDGLLKSYYYLGTEDISDGTTVSKVDQKTWETTIERASYGMCIYDFTFVIVVDFTGTKFKGTCIHNEDTFQWTGEARADTNAWLLKKKRLRSASPAFLLQTNSINSSELSLQNLLNISPNIAVVDGDKTVLVDVAQQETGVYFQDILVNSLDDEYVTYLFGTRRVLPDNVQKTMDAHLNYYKGKAVMNAGQLLHQTFHDQGTKEDQAAVSKIDMDKIKADWEAGAKDAEFKAQANELYCNAFANRIPEIKPYLLDGKSWSVQLHDLVTSEPYLNMWRAQIASSQFPNVKDKIFEFYTKLTVLDNSEAGCERAQHVITVLFSAVLNVAAQKVEWVDDYYDQFVKFLKDTVINIRGANLSELEHVLAIKNAEEIKESLENLISVYDSLDQLVEDIAELFTLVSRMPEAVNKSLVEVVDIAMAHAGPSGFEKLVSGFGKAGKVAVSKVIRVLFFSAGLGVCLFLFTDKNSAEGIVADIGLGICATTFFVKGMGAFMETALAKWIGEKIGSVGDRLAGFCESFGKWFSSEGEIGGLAGRIFGKNANTFLKTRLGPACAAAAIVLSAFFLNDAVKSHDTFNIVMESLNMTFAILDLGLMGLSMLSFSWAGPVGIAIAIIGGLTIIIQLIYNWLNPPKHVEDHVERFVNGPLKESGYVFA